MFKKSLITICMTLTLVGATVLFTSAATTNFTLSAQSLTDSYGNSLRPTLSSSRQTVTGGNAGVLITSLTGVNTTFTVYEYKAFSQHTYVTHVNAKAYGSQVSSKKNMKNGKQVFVKGVGDTNYSRFEGKGSIYH